METDETFSEEEDMFAGSMIDSDDEYETIVDLERIGDPSLGPRFRQEGPWMVPLNPHVTRVSPVKQLYDYTYRMYPIYIVG